MAKLYEDDTGNYDVQRKEREKQRLQHKQEQEHQLQRDLADAISRLAPLDDIRILLACGARPDGPVTQGLHPIHYAAYQNFVAAVGLLVLRGCDINAMDDNGYTPVHLAAERGYKDLLKFLIDNRAKVCFNDMRKQSTNYSMADEPLSLALKRNHMDCAELLLRNGADPNTRYFMGSEINLVSILKVQAIRLLLKYGANPNSRDRSGLTPLMKAARHPQGYATVELLIDHGADVNDIAGERHDYRTVLHHSIFSGNIDLIRLILVRGAQYPRLDFDKPSPMDIAIISGRHDIVKLLIEFDADINWGSHTTIGQPLHTALTQRIENKYEIVKTLLDRGADPNSLVTSNRNTGPALHDYLHSSRQCANSVSSPQNSSPSSISEMSHLHPICGPDFKMVRLLLMYGARVILKTANQNPYGLVRVLERIHDDITLDLLHLLIDAAEEIDWFMMSKVIYNCLRNTNRSRANELFDPSVAADMTPDKLRELLAKDSTHYHGIGERLIKLMDGGNGSSTILTLKQISRLKIRNTLIQDGKRSKGHNLIERTNDLPLPKVLRKYLLYQD